MEEKSFPRLQWSHFIGQDQVVVRADSIEEFITLKKLLMDEVNGVKSPPPEDPTANWPASTDKVNVSADTFEKDHICPEHGVAMKEGESKTKSDKFGKPLKYWSHGKYSDSTPPEWMMCFGKGYKSRK